MPGLQLAQKGGGDEIMGDTTAIHWTNSTWNPWVGCRKVSAGCKNCYMFRDMARYGKDPLDVHRTAKATFEQPLHYADPRLIFTCSWSDFFIEQADAWRDEAWRIIRDTPHTYQILTKRPERIAEHLPADWGEGYPNVWLGVSVENQGAAHRIMTLRKIPARIRFISAEPLLGPLYLTDYTAPILYFHWLIVGGESGPNARPMSKQWARSLISSAETLGIPVFFKQVGGTAKIGGVWGGDELDGKRYQQFPAYLPPKPGALPLTQLEMFG
jgi:protein gp37